jgi:hypothetical protein
VEDICLVRQQCTPMTVAFKDDAVADYFDAQVDQGRTPAQFARIWIHTHPGNSPLPSGTDETTFDRCFGAADWAVMLILACGGRSYALLRLGTGPVVGHIGLPLALDFSGPFPAAAPERWEAEYWENVAWDADPRDDFLAQPTPFSQHRPSWRDDPWSCVDSAVCACEIAPAGEVPHG